VAASPLRAGILPSDGGPARRRTEGADYAARAKDLPLARFHSRHNAATEAAGYGKALFFHLLRNELGDGPFLAGLSRFYAENRFRPAGYRDLVRSLEAAAGLGSGGVDRRSRN
jgi:hypothetical protein